MEHYVTLFDSLFLPQGLALHRSMQRHAGRHLLWILCIDDAAHEVLQRLQLQDVRLLRLDGVETAELLKVKAMRSRGEYCWTLTPFTPGFVFDADATVERVTYVDADLWLMSPPDPLFREFERSGKSVLITEHGYAPEYDRTHISGRYCVQFVTFVRDRGERVRAWWSARCLEWCYARLEDGKFGDQMYLDDWHIRFADDVHVLQQKSCLQAPWNISRFPPCDAVAFHFHGLRLLRGGHVLLTDHYNISPPTAAAVYRPYLHDLQMAIASLCGVGHVLRPQIDRPRWLVRARVLAQQVRLRWRERRPSRFARL